MLYDRLENIEQYTGLFENLDTAIAYIAEHDLDELPLGRTDIDGDKVFVKVGVEYASQRYAATDTNLYVAVPGYVDLWAEVMFKPTRKVGVFVRGGNLLNQTNYRYLVYRALGANVMAGATFSF